MVESAARCESREDAEMSVESIEVHKLAELVRGIVEREMPTEALAFEVAGEKMLKERLAPQPQDKSNAAKASQTREESYEFVQEAASVIDFVGLVVGVAEVVKWTTAIVAKYKKSPNANDIHSAWTQKMIDAGLPKDVATRIAKQCHEDL